MQRFLEYINTMSGAVDFAIFAIVVTFLIICISNLEIKPSSTAKKLTSKSLSAIGRKVRKSERDYHRGCEIGQYKKTGFRVKFYDLLNDLTIDLGMKVKGTTPYELFFFILAFSVMLTMFSSLILFSSLFVGFIAYPFVCVGVICALYTKGNVAHENRINAVIEAENIICNNIESGVRVAVRNSITSFPKDVQAEFQDFLHELDDSTFITTALLNLNDKLGSIADKFISKCIKFELYEEHGTAGTFKDIVEMNTYKTQTRIRMSRSFEQVMNEFKICAGLIILFLTGVLAIYPFVRNFYFTNFIGQLLLLGDLLLFILEFVIITYLRAKDFEHM